MKYILTFLLVLIISTNIAFATDSLSPNNFPQPAPIVVPTINTPSAQGITDAVTAQSKTFFQAFLQKLDAFRQAQEVVATNLRDQAKAKLANNLAAAGQNIIDKGLGIAQAQTNQNNSLGDPIDYLTLIGYSFLASFLANTTYFYTVAIILGLITLRAVFRRAF